MTERLSLIAIFMVQFSHPYMTTGKTIALTRWTFVGKIMSLLFNMLSRFSQQLLKYAAKCSFGSGSCSDGWGHAQ